MPEEITQSRAAPRRDASPPAKRYRATTEIVYCPDPMAVGADRKWIKVKPDTVISDDLPGINYAWCLKRGHLEEVV